MPQDDLFKVKENHISNVTKYTNFFLKIHIHKKIEVKKMCFRKPLSDLYRAATMASSKSDTHMKDLRNTNRKKRQNFTTVCCSI